MPFHSILYEVSEHIATIALNRPEQRNAMSRELTAELLTALEMARDDEAVRVVVLTGAGDKAFCAGGDLSGMGNDGLYSRYASHQGSLQMFRLIQELGKPVIAAVNGACMAGGLGLALACDLVVAADTAFFGTPEINVGLFPMIISATIARNVPRKKTLELLLLGERIDARAAEQAGMVNKVVPYAELAGAAREWAKKMAAKSPAVMRLGKDAFYTMADMDFHQAARYLAGMLTMTLETEDAAEGTSAFVAKRAPQWKGR